MEYRKLSLVKGSTSYSSKRGDLNVESEDWLSPEDFKKVIFANDYVAMEFSGPRTIHMFIFSMTGHLEDTVNSLHRIIKKIPADDLEREIMLVTYESMKPNVVTNIQRKMGVLVSNYIYSNFFMVPNQHILSGPIEVLSSEEEEALMTWLMTNKSALPKIKKHDPIDLYYDFNIGDIVKITRKTFNGEVITYLVVD